MSPKKRIDPHHVQLDDEEKELFESFEHGEWKSVKNLEKKMISAKKAATNYLEGYMIS